MQDAQAHWLLKLPPPIWLLLLLVAAWAADRIFAARVIAELRSIPAALVFALLGLAVGVSGRLAFARAGTEIIPTSAANKTLVTGGPFRLSRNPMYLGLVLLALGIAFYVATIHFFAVPVLLFLLCNFVFVPYEEAKMQRQFGTQFSDYRHRVRRWL
jgi:protein-S-isoprenylcysteine O-methyltransferase Ste14